MSKVERLKWPSDKLTDTLYDVCVQSRIDTEFISKTEDLYTISYNNTGLAESIGFPLELVQTQFIAN